MSGAPQHDGLEVRRARTSDVPAIKTLIDIYAASEKPIEGVTSLALLDRMRQFGHRGAEYAPTAADGVARVVDGAAPGDLIITLGAGSVSQLGERILEKLPNA